MKDNSFTPKEGALLILGSIIISLLIFGPALLRNNEEEPTLEVYNFFLDGQVVTVYNEPANFTLELKEASWVNLTIVNKIIQVFVHADADGTVSITSVIQTNETILCITVTGVIANTSQGFIECQELEQVSFLPPTTLITTAYFEFLTETYLYKGQYLPLLSLPPSPPEN